MLHPAIQTAQDRVDALLAEREGLDDGPERDRIDNELDVAWALVRQASIAVETDPRLLRRLPNELLKRAALEDDTLEEGVPFTGGCGGCL